MNSPGIKTIGSSIVYLACALLFQAIAGCDQDRETVSLEGTLEGTAVTSVLRRGNGDDPVTLDPALAEDVHTFNVLFDIYEGLLAEAADGSLVPGVAETWELSDDGQTYRFRLRSNARWSNGDPVLAADFVNAFQRVAVPDSQSIYGFLLEPIENFASVR